MDRADHILAILDRCCDACTFPMLDNGYYYLAAARLSLHRSVEDWAMVFETFGFSPRLGAPSLNVETIGSRLHERNRADGYVSRAAFDAYLAQHPHDEHRAFYPLAEGDWMDRETVQVAIGARAIGVRDRTRALPSREAYAGVGIELADPERVYVFELSRYLASVDRDLVLATAAEQRVSVRPEMVRVLQLDAWYHPDIAAGAVPSQSETFQQLALVLETGDPLHYRPTAPPNSHWKNWPDGGTL